MAGPPGGTRCGGRRWSIAIAYTLWSTGLAGLTLADAVTLTMLEPVVATVLAIAVLAEPAGPTTILGIMTTLAGVWVASTVRSRQFAATGNIKAGLAGTVHRR